MVPASTLIQITACFIWELLRQKSEKQLFHQLENQRKWQSLWNWNPSVSFQPFDLEGIEQQHRLCFMAMDGTPRSRILDCPLSQHLSWRGWRLFDNGIDSKLGKPVARAAARRRLSRPSIRKTRITSWSAFSLHFVEMMLMPSAWPLLCSC